MLNQVVLRQIKTQTRPDCSKFNIQKNKIDLIFGQTPNTFTSGSRSMPKRSRTDSLIFTDSLYKS